MAEDEILFRIKVVDDGTGKLAELDAQLESLKKQRAEVAKMRADILYNIKAMNLDRCYKQPVLVGFEESQAITIQLRARGIEAYSCDIQECSGGHPEWHLKMDIFQALKLKKWGAIILHPPCTYTALCGNRWYWNSEKRIHGINLCKKAWNEACSICDYVALEQPKTIMQKYIGRRTQTIHPWQFGHGETKETWLWLKGFPKLQPTEIVEGREKKIWKMPPSKDRSKLRSKTYPGIAKAIAEQWF